jgi:hypothetical protein
MSHPPILFTRTLLSIPQAPMKTIPTKVARSGGHGATATTARAMTGDVDRAEAIVERAERACGELGLLAEGFDPRTRLAAQQLPGQFRQCCVLSQRNARHEGPMPYTQPRSDSAHSSPMDGASMGQPT